jgi:hypothetical protein
MRKADGASERAQRAKIAAYVRWSREPDPAAALAPARAAFARRFLDEVDLARELPEAERDRRAALARRAYYQRLALASVRARRRRRGSRHSDAAEQEAAASEGTQREPNTRALP